MYGSGLCITNLRGVAGALFEAGTTARQPTLGPLDDLAKVETYVVHKNNLPANIVSAHCMGKEARMWPIHMNELAVGKQLKRPRTPPDQLWQALLECLDDLIGLAGSRLYKQAAHCGLGHELHDILKRQDQSKAPLYNEQDGAPAKYLGRKNTRMKLAISIEVCIIACMASLRAFPSRGRCWKVGRGGESLPRSLSDGFRARYTTG
mmetsp:Transcript_73183/g.214513  ORF Transcript_73183/g.214513 Transcript_73183/m.214513 type:complete len:206 (-) Transcript_73183:1721-2338(-)